MAQTLASMGSSAQIIHLPNAALQPPCQKNGPGRLPKMVTSYNAFLRKRREHSHRKVTQGPRVQEQQVIVATVEKAMQKLTWEFAGLGALLVREKAKLKNIYEGVSHG